MEFLRGLICIAILFILVFIYRLLSEFRVEDSKRGGIVRKLFQISWSTFIVYLAVFSFLIPLIILIVMLCS